MGKEGNRYLNVILSSVKLKGNQHKSQSFVTLSYPITTPPQKKKTATVFYTLKMTNWAYVQEWSSSFQLAPVSPARHLPFHFVFTAGMKRNVTGHEVTLTLLMPIPRPPVGAKGNGRRYASPTNMTWLPCWEESSCNCGEKAGRPDGAGVLGLGWGKGSQEPTAEMGLCVSCMWTSINFINCIMAFHLPLRVSLLHRRIWLYLQNPHPKIKLRISRQLCCISFLIAA